MLTNAVYPNSRFRWKWRHACLSVVFSLMACLGVRADDLNQASDPAAIEFFEREIRPLLIEKCQSCHNPDEANANLQITDRESLLRGGDRGPAIVPGDPAASLLVVAVKYTDELQMPPKSRLSDAEIEKLERWIALQAPWPASAASVTEAPKDATKDAGFQASEKHKKWWAFQPVSQANPPVVASFPGWAQNEIDQFIAKELAANHLQPTSPADRRTWIRRATFDLTGLPPIPIDVEAFVRDVSPDSREKVVDRLLVSPAYGERWGRHWLDVVRYADYYQENPKEHGSYRNFELLEAWRYRDWVVKSLNQDWPFDKFTKYHIAGDLIPSPQGLSYYEDGLVGTTFLTMGSWDNGDADKEKVISDIVDDQIDTIGKAFLGISFGCARCHDHKFDPVSNEDYYALAGIFYSTRTISDLSSKGDHTCLNRVPLAPPSVVQKRAEQVKQLAEIDAKIAELDKRDPKVAADDPQRVALVAERKGIEGGMEPELPVAMAVQEGGTPGGLFPGIQDVPIHLRGSYARLGRVVPRRLPSFLAADYQVKIESGSGRRELANWVASSQNTLLARVIVNRIWQGHFGEGIVNTPSNFGLVSEPPSHPELLDWLSVRLMAENWSLKSLHRRIMLSATYQQASVTRAEDLAADPANRWLGRFNARRLEAEAIRDSMMNAADRLAGAMGGPAQTDPLLPHRSLYVQTTRWDRNNFSTLFDAANPDTSIEKRSISTVAPQALLLLNNEFSFTIAQRFVERLFREAPDSDMTRIQRTYELLYSRPPKAEEIAVLQRLLAESSALGNRSAWEDVAHVLICSNEFVTLD